MLESIDDLRGQIQRARTLKEAVPPGPKPRPSPAEPTPARADAAPASETDGDATKVFRPTQRPSMALLHVFDDGEPEGELIRIRSGSFTIGRVEGDLVIPHDAGMSGRHVEITRRFEDGAYVWHLRDLQSLNGTFVRASSSYLKNGQEFLIGSGRFRFDTVTGEEDTGSSADELPATTRKWQMPGSKPHLQAAPSLVELTPAGEGRRLPLDRPESWLGRDAKQCNLALDDLFASPRHARVARDDRGRWMIHNHKSKNGLWIRVAEIPLDRGGQFQCGEQRFLVRIL